MGRGHHDHEARRESDIRHHQVSNHVDDDNNPSLIPDSDYAYGER